MQDDRYEWEHFLLINCDRISILRVDDIILKSKWNDQQRWSYFKTIVLFWNYQKKEEIADEINKKRFLEARDSNDFGDWISIHWFMEKYDSKAYYSHTIFI